MCYIASLQQVTTKAFFDLTSKYMYSCLLREYRLIPEPYIGLQKLEVRSQRSEVRDPRSNVTVVLLTRALCGLRFENSFVAKEHGVFW